MSTEHTAPAPGMRPRIPGRRDDLSERQRSPRRGRVLTRRRATPNPPSPEPVVPVTTPAGHAPVAWSPCLLPSLLRGLSAGLLTPPSRKTKTRRMRAAVEARRLLSLYRQRVNETTHPNRLIEDTTHEDRVRTLLDVAAHVSRALAWETEGLIGDAKATPETVLVSAENEGEPWTW